MYSLLALLHTLLLTSTQANQLIPRSLGRVILCDWQTPETCCRVKLWPACHMEILELVARLKLKGVNFQQTLPEHRLAQHEKVDILDYIATGMSIVQRSRFFGLEFPQAVPSSITQGKWTGFQCEYRAEDDPGLQIPFEAEFIGWLRTALGYTFDATGYFQTDPLNVAKPGLDLKGNTQQKAQIFGKPIRSLLGSSSAGLYGSRQVCVDLLEQQRTLKEPWP